MINKDPNHVHTYDAQGRMTCCSLEEKIDAKSGTPHIHKQDHDHDDEDAGPPEQPRTRRERGLVLGDDLSERRVGRLHAEPEEAQRRLQQDRARHQQRRVDHDDADGVRKDVPEDDPAVARARNPRGVHELALTQGEELTAHET